MKLPSFLGFGAVIAAGLACGGLPAAPTPTSTSTPAPPAAPTPTGTPLEALTATSGAGAEAILDGDPATAWRPAGSAQLEGVLLRFEEPTTMSSVAVWGCGAGTVARLYVDGSAIATPTLGSEPVTVSLGEPGAVRSLYLRIDEAGSDPCVAEIAVDNDGQPVAIAPPRRVSGKVRASSTLKPVVPYRAAYLFDGRTHFAWVEGAEGDGIGETVEVDLAEARSIRAIDVWNGYQRSDDHFAKNSRLRRVRLSAGGEARELAVEDRSGKQTIPVDPPLSGKSLRLEIVEAASGSKYPDLVISELRFRDEQGPFGVAVDDLKKAEDELHDQLAGSPLAKVVGQAWKSACGDAGQLRLRADSSLVFYGTGPSDGGEATNVVDGAWAVSRAEGPWAKIELYARRHRVQTTWYAYGGEEVEEVTKIAGGSLEFALAADLGGDLEEELKALGRGAAEDRIRCLDAGARRDLVAKGGILVKGPAITDVFVPLD